MTGTAKPSGTPSLADDERRLAELADALANAVEAALSGWVRRTVAERAAVGQVAVDVARLDAAVSTCVVEIGGRMRTLLAADIDDQATNPLGILRDAVRYPTEVLAAADVAPVARDDFAVRSFPDDRYGLTPASFADVDESLYEPGLLWGAAKAHVHLRRRRERAT